MSVVYLGLGSNLGNKCANLHDAIQAISLEVGDVLNTSSFYQSEPWGFNSENTFVNAVIAITTELSPMDLLDKLKQIEQNLGRVSPKKTGYSDRLIDIDVLLYDNLVINTPGLNVPHRHMQNRDFVLFPLREIAADIKHPTLNKTISELAENIQNNTTVLNKKEC